MRNARLNELLAGIKTHGRNIKNLRYADGTTLIAESEEKPKSLLMKVKEENEKAGLRLNAKKKPKTDPTDPTDPITVWKIEGEIMEVETDFLFLASKITMDCDCSHEIRRQFLLGRKAMTT